MAPRFGITNRELAAIALENGFLPLRYVKNIGTIGLDGQAKLLRSTAVIVGAGGIGGQAAELLVRMGVGTLVTAIFIVRVYDRFTPRQIASYAFTLVAAGALWLAFVVSNDWSTFPVLLGLVAFGIGQGALVTLLFNVLVTSSPKELSGDVGAMRGTANNMAASVGTALMGALVVGVLSAGIMSSVTANPIIGTELKAEVDLDNINFLSNDRLEARLESTSATPEQVTEAMRINEEARLRALKIAFFALACVALLAIFPSRRLPDYRPGEVTRRATREDLSPDRVTVGVAAAGCTTPRSTRRSPCETRPASRSECDRAARTRAWRRSSPPSGRRRRRPPATHSVCASPITRRSYSRSEAMAGSGMARCHAALAGAPRPPAGTTRSRVSAGTRASAASRPAARP